MTGLLIHTFKVAPKYFLFFEKIKQKDKLMLWERGDDVNTREGEQRYEDDDNNGDITDKMREGKMGRRERRGKAIA